MIVINDSPYTTFASAVTYQQHTTVSCLCTGIHSFVCTVLSLHVYLTSYPGQNVVGASDNLYFFLIHKAMRDVGLCKPLYRQRPPSSSAPSHVCRCHFEVEGIKELTNPQPYMMPRHVLHGAYIRKLLFFPHPIAFHPFGYGYVTNCTQHGLCLQGSFCQE